MKWQMIVITLGVLVLAGCTGGELNSAPVGTDCGTNETCLANAAETCQQAYGTTVQTLEEVGLNMTVYVGVQGGTASLCTYYLKIAGIVIPEGMTTQQESLLLAQIVGKDMNCKLSAGSDLDGIFDNLDKCTGPAAEVIRSIASIMGAINGDND